MTQFLKSVWSEMWEQIGNFLSRFKIWKSRNIWDLSIFIDWPAYLVMNLTTGPINWAKSNYPEIFHKSSQGSLDDMWAIYQTLPLAPKSSFFPKNGQKVRVYRFHFYLKNRKSKRETKTHARRMLPPPPHHHLWVEIHNDNSNGNSANSSL